MPETPGSGMGRTVQASFRSGPTDMPSERRKAHRKSTADSLAPTFEAQPTNSGVYHDPPYVQADEIITTDQNVGHRPCTGINAPRYARCKHVPLILSTDDLIGQVYGLSRLRTLMPAGQQHFVQVHPDDVAVSTTLSSSTMQPSLLPIGYEHWDFNTMAIRDAWVGSLYRPH